MKKTYIAPEALIVDIETQFVLANSQTMSLKDDTFGEGFTLNEGGSRSNLWGED